MTDENTLTMPDAWRRVLHPRRDRPPVAAPPAPDRAAAARVRALVDEKRTEIEEILDLPGNEPEVAEAARAHLRGDATPLGAAAVAQVSVVLHGLHRDGGDRLFTDAWLTGHGAAFAACALADIGAIRAVAEVAAPSGRGAARRRGTGGLDWTGVRWRRAGDARLDWWIERGTVRRVRAHLAAAPDDVYTGAVEGLAENRGHHLRRLLAAYLAPTRQDWVEELCADPGYAGTEHSPDRWMLFCALGGAHQPAALGLPLDYNDRDLDVLASLVDGVGPEPVVPLLLDALDDVYVSADQLRTVSGVLAALPFDGAFQAIVERVDRPGVPPALLAAARRFPARAMRLLPEAGGTRAADLLAGHVRANPGLAEETLPALSGGARESVRGILDASRRVPYTTVLPPLLAEPPWTRPVKKAKPVVIKGLASPDTRATAWEPDERAEWASRAAHLWRWADRLDPDKLAARFGKLPGHQQVVVVARGGEEAVRPLLAGWEPPVVWDEGEWMRAIIGRFELDAHDPALIVARGNPAVLGGLLMPLRSDEIARTMADWLVRLKTAGKTARAWFGRHGTAAAPALVPDALGKAGPARRAAEHALRLIAGRHGAEPVVAAARVHGDEAAAAVAALLAADPLEALPAKIPAVDWADSSVLPQILLRDRRHALPDAAAAHVLTMLAMSKPDAPYAGVGVVRELCDPESLAEWGWALFRWWELCGAPSKENWALTQLALTGDDETVRRLTPVIRAWPGEGGHAKAVLGLDVLAAIGTDTALMHLHTVAQRVKFKALKTRAREKIEEVAAELELTAEQLADRLVPDFGLDASGTLTLDYGPRAFTIAFDERLKPTITDDTGKPRKALPKPGAKDDPELAPAAAKRFAALKKDVRTVAADQLARLEQAMVDRRRWPLAEFRDLLAGHPLLRHLVRRLVWTTDGGPAFRVAEDGTFADASDDTVVLPDGARVGVAHPLDLGDDLAAWSEVFADYEILQPFAQLARPVHVLTGEERDAGNLARFEGAKVASGAVLGLVKRGWERGEPQDAGVEVWISRRVGPKRHLVIALDPGIPVGSPDLLGDQVLTDVRLAERPGDHFWRTEAPSGRFGDLDPVIASEVLADLTHLTESNGASR
ncbi:DUF4132 domain-containing protein [Actinomadura sp. WMMB 499]|uniref:DUF4132 domain-containing protein n=1 Tax=Actinomadura sp. WMMB 499 TaxID=1219491 RepID=UPI0012450519|nr:DUF4132 domain-containing protein [Actinomadura sp. WMMB 499]QFG20441.1 DUF4132 domain-containing protein [Actinomadura sp. WMMB 499]